MLQDHIWKAYCSRIIAKMLLEQCAFQIWSLSIFDLENSFRLWMVQDHKVLMVQDHVVLDMWTISRG